MKKSESIASVSDKSKKKSKQKEILLEQINESQIKRSSPKQNNHPIKLVFLTCLNFAVIKNY